MSHHFIEGILTAIFCVIFFAGTCSFAADKDGGQPAAEALSQNPAAPKDPFEVPDGSIEELQRYIAGLNVVQPSSSLRPALAELYKKRAAAEIKACEKILAAQPNPEQAHAAVRVKVAALLLLGKLGDATAQAKLEATVDQVEKFGFNSLARDVQWAALTNLAQRAGGMDDKEYTKLVEKLKGLLSEGPIDSSWATLAITVGSAGEQSQRRALAIRAYREFGGIVAESDDEWIRGFAAAMFGAARRLDLIGKPLFLEGTTVAGRPWDWKTYRGKVVLIDFFATGNAPCRKEIANILACYKGYHQRGFDVVGVSIDRDRKAIEDFVDGEKLPWAILLDPNEARGTVKSMATYYGIFTIPQTILVGKDGKVLALNVRGPQLGKRLEELLGAAER